MESNRDLFLSENWNRAGEGSRYLQLSRHIASAIGNGLLKEGFQLPPERDMAELGQVSRVTVRKAVSELVDAGLVEQRRGSGTFVLAEAPRTEQSLSSLVSFTENMQARGRTSTSKILSRGLYSPTPDEMMALGLAPSQKVARIERLRFADGTPMALELSSLPSDVLPNPDEVSTSLYAVLRRSGQAPSRAIQRVSAINVPADRASIMGVAENTALLEISRTAFLDSGRPIEFTLGLYRPDIYDFVAEIRPDDGV